MKKTFLIQTDLNGFYNWDFTWELARQLKEDGRVYEDFDVITAYMDERAKFVSPLMGIDWPRDLLSPCIPVGSVEFVHTFLKEFHGFEPQPLYIPEQLRGFTGRDMYFDEVVSESDALIKSYGRMFAKESGVVKGYTGLVGSVEEIPDDIGFVHLSEEVDILSEYRVFVHRKEVMGIHHYSGDVMVLPNIGDIWRMVEAFEDSPIAYTLDVAVIKGVPKMDNRSGKYEQTVVIECHNLYSCGLYGFSHPKYPYMLSQAWFELLRTYGKQLD